jgi:heme-degrading monooxygenase HmoA
LKFVLTIFVLSLLSIHALCGVHPLTTRQQESGSRANEPITASTRVFSRWTVSANREDDFISAWGAAMRQNLTASKDFRGGFLLRSQKERTQFLAIELWTSIRSWHAFQARSSAFYRDSVQSIVSSHSTEALDQIFDRLETSEWKRRLVRIYGLRVEEKNRNVFIDTWLKVNMSIGAKVDGARGGLLLNDRGDRSMFYEVVRWDSMDAWKRFIAAPPADPEAFQKIFSLMSVISAESFDEIDLVIP